jgi:hypothetical protein
MTDQPGHDDTASRAKQGVHTHSLFQKRRAVYITSSVDAKSSRRREEADEKLERDVDHRMMANRPPPHAGGYYLWRASERL